MAIAETSRAKTAAYRELEIFLAKTQKEIGDAFDDLVYGDGARMLNTGPEPRVRNGPSLWPFISSSASRSTRCRHCGRVTSPLRDGAKNISSVPGSPPPAVPPRRNRLARVVPERNPRSLSMPPPTSFWNTYPPLGEALKVSNGDRRHRRVFRNVSLPVELPSPPSRWNGSYDENCNPNRPRPPAEFWNGGRSPPPPPRRCRFGEGTEPVLNGDSGRSRLDNWEWRRYRSPPWGDTVVAEEPVLHWCLHCQAYLQHVAPQPPVVRSVTLKRPDQAEPMSRPVDVDQLAAFVDLMVSEVNSLTTDDGQAERSRRLATFAGRFTVPELRPAYKRPLPKRAPSSPLRDESLEDEVFECIQHGTQASGGRTAQSDLHHGALPDWGVPLERKTDAVTIKLVQDGNVVADTTVEIKAPPSGQLTSALEDTGPGAELTLSPTERWPPSNRNVTIQDEPRPKAAVERCGPEHVHQDWFVKGVQGPATNHDYPALDSSSEASGPERPFMVSSPKDDHRPEIPVWTTPQSDSSTLQKSRNVGEFMRQLETSIRESSTDEGDSSSRGSRLQRPMTDAVTQTSPLSLSPSVSLTWLNGYGGHSPRPGSWFDESVNDRLSALGGATPADSAEDLDAVRLVERRSVSVSASISDLEMETSSSYSLSESLDRLAAGCGGTALSSTSSSSTLGSPELTDVWVLRSSYVHQTPPEKRLASPIALDFETCMERRWTGSAPYSDTRTEEAGGSCHTLVSTTPTTDESRFRSRESTPDSLDSPPPGSPPADAARPGDTCSLKAAHKGGCGPAHDATKFGTVPISKPKTLAPSVSGARSSPGFSNPPPAHDAPGSGDVAPIATMSMWVASDVWSDMNKSSSAPVLGERDHRHDVGGATCRRSMADAGSQTFMAPRSQSAREISELEAVEACKWLRATGFPQYAQMFEDMQFPIDVSSVHKDHYFLDQDSLQSLFRRLNALNRCARMRLDNLPRKISADGSDDENQCALSENWEFQRQSRRWSRIPGNFEAALAKRSSDKDEWAEGSGDAEEPPLAGDGVVGPPNSAAAAATESPVPTDDSGRTAPPAPEGGSLKRSGSERLKDGAKAFLRRVESLKSRRSKRKNREAVVISGPQLLDVPGQEERELSIHITPPDTPVSPLCSSSPSPNSPSDVSQNGAPSPGSGHRLGRRPARQFFGGGLRYRADGEPCALSDSECSPTLWRSGPTSPTGSSGATAPGRCYADNLLAPDSPLVADGSDGINYRTGSFNLGLESAAYRERFQKRGNKRSASGLDPELERHSLYDNVPVVIFNKGYTDENGQPLHEADIFKNITSLNTAFSRGAAPADRKSSDDGLSILERASSTDADSGSVTSTALDVVSRLTDHDGRSLADPQQWDRRDSGVGLSLARSDRSQSGWQTDPRCHRPSIPCRSVPLNELTCGQMMVIRKLALLKLTALMERYSPSNRSGWNWAMPKFIKRMKMPDYKDKTVFGVPLVVILQRTGHPIPPPIQEAVRFVRKNAVEAVGIFRKSGVRSRIQKLKNLAEVNPAAIDYDEQQPYDVADLIKQYFRDLPEALLTNKMSETFIGIYQHIEPDARLEALQAAVVLMPDENREVLQALLSFLKDVSNHSNENQMPASNLAVCFAPSLFHLSGGLRSQSTSPRRRRPAGVPDQRELNENRAAHECLAHMIREFASLFSIPDDILAQCRCPYMEQWQPPSVEEIRGCGGDREWRSVVETSVQWLLKESREKFKGWVSVSTADNAELAYRKMDDRNPLRMWKVAVEVEAPPVELLQRLLRERHLWDSSLVKWRTIDRLDKQTEVFQYVCNSMTPLPVRDYCVLRSWKTDFPKGTCVLVETSVDHPEATPLLGGVRGIVLASRYLIEPCGSGKSRVTHVSRVDTRGRSPDWYHKVYGHTCALYLSRLRDSVQHAAEGPESKV